MQSTTDPSTAGDYGRSSSFHLGISGGGPRATSLETASSRQNALAPQGFDPASVLDAYQMPGYHPQDGNSAFDAQRQVPSGQIPSPNGSSMSTYNVRNPSNIRTRLAIK